MRKRASRAEMLGIIVSGMAMFWGCATPAVVFISPGYYTQPVTRVTVLGFADASGQPGSGASMADIFEKYLFNLQYQIVDQNQPHDAEITGSVSELTNTSEQTVLVDVPQEVTEPVYQDVVVQGRHGGLRTVTEQTGVQTVETDQSVPETETLPARVGLNVRLVSVKTGELLWSGSASADGLNIPSAAEAAASKLIDALRNGFEKHKTTPAN